MEIYWYDLKIVEFGTMHSEDHHLSTIGDGRERVTASRYTGMRHYRMESDSAPDRPDVIRSLLVGDQSLAEVVGRSGNETEFTIWLNPASGFAGTPPREG